MAFNSRKAPHSWQQESADDRIRQSDSLHAQRRVHNEKVQETLDEMFINVFDSEIIRSVAHSCGWKLNKSIETLIMLAEESEFPDKLENKLDERKSSECNPSSCGEKYENSFSSELYKTNQLEIIEPDQSKEIPEQIACPKPIMPLAKKKCVMMNTSLGKIKVAYKGNSDTSDDDDADVVIEEENELEVIPSDENMLLNPFLSTVDPLFDKGRIPFQKTYKDFAETFVTSPVKPDQTYSDILNTFNTSAGKKSENKVSNVSEKKTKHWPQYERIKKQICDGIKVMILLRGVPGSGKTSLGRHIIKTTLGSNVQNCIFSTDDYFVCIGNGKYAFDPSLLSKAHFWNQQRVFEALNNEVNPVIVDNTNLEAWEMEPYARMAVVLGYNVELIEPKTSWRNNSFELERKNTHNVSRRKIEDMLGRFERDLTSGKLLSLYNLSYSSNKKPPQYISQKKQATSIKLDVGTGAIKKLKMKQNEGKLEKPSLLNEDGQHNQTIHDKAGKLSTFSVPLTDKNPPASSTPKVKFKKFSFGQTDGNEDFVSEEKLLARNNGNMPHGSNNPMKVSESSPEQKIICKDKSSESEVPVKSCFVSESLDCSKEKLKIQGISGCSEGIDKKCILGGAFSDHLTEIPAFSGERVEKIESKESAEHLPDGDAVSLKYRCCPSPHQCDDSFDGVDTECKKNCMEYVVVLKNGTLLPRKSYVEVRKDMEGLGRQWEYFLKCKDSKPLVCPEKSNASTNSNSCVNLEHLDIIAIEEKISLSHCVNMPKEDKGAIEKKFVKDVCEKSLLDDDFILSSKVEEEKKLHCLYQGEDISGPNDWKLLSAGDEDAAKTSIAFVGLENSSCILSPSELPKLDRSNSCSPPLERKMPPGEMDERNSCDLKLEPKTKTEASIYDCSDGQDNLLVREVNQKERNMITVDEKGVEKESDLLKIWTEQGSSWDETLPKENGSSNPTNDCITPKPARKMKRPDLDLVDCEENKAGKNDMIAAENCLEIWSPVEDPVTTWEATESVSYKSEELCEDDKPQPQREIFFDIGHPGKVGDKSSFDQLNDDEELNCQTDRQREKFQSINADSESNSFQKCVPKLSILAAAALKSSDMEIQENLTSLDSTVSFSSFHNDASPGKNTLSSSTNTHHLDFITLGNVNTGSEKEFSGIKILIAQGRNIMDVPTRLEGMQEVQRTSHVLKLDKSSMTYDIVSSASESENLKEQLEELVKMFPHCNIEDLLEIYEKCNRDVNWTVELLLESASQGIEISTVNIGDRVQLNLRDLEQISAPETKSEAVVNANSSSEVSGDTNGKAQGINKRNGRRDRGPASETSLLLKKQLEETIVISDTHYSEHVSRLRRLRHAETSNDDGNTAALQESSPFDGLLDNTYSGAADANQSSYGGTLCPDAPPWEAYGTVESITSDVPEEEEEETVSLFLDSSLEDQLHKLFGTASLPFNQEMKPPLNLPLSLARQLHSYMMEAEQNTYDQMLQDDEVLAKQLQDLENQAGAEPLKMQPEKVPELREIMDMEMALAIYKADQKQRSSGKEDLATKLTKSKLCEWFPSIPRDVLFDVYEAHDRSFEATLEVLLASTEEDKAVQVVMTAEARAAQEQALLQRACQEGQKRKELEGNWTEREVATQEDAMEDANNFRLEARNLLGLRKECQQKAQKAYQRGLPAVASYYSQMARLYMKRIEDCNACAASSLLLAHSLGNLPTTLDLHFLLVVEAMLVLDVFLDHHLRRLQTSPMRTISVFVITGRGARSLGGRSRIKPAVIQRLGQRQLRYEEINPGLLKVLIPRSAACTSALSA